MSKPYMGAKVMYCGHDGWFIADIFKIGTANAIKANGPITGSNLVRGYNEQATHQVFDFPNAGMWAPNLGVLVVPERQVKEIKR